MRIADIKVGENFSRETEGDCSELAESISRVGLIQPVVVDGEGNLVAGFRRYHACKMLGWEDIPTKVTECGNPGLVNLIENIERRDLTFYEEAVAVKNLFPDYTSQQVADAVGKTKGWSRPRLKLWELPEPVVEMVKRGDLTATKVAQILATENPQEAAEKVVGKTEHQANVALGKCSKPPKKDLQRTMTKLMEADKMDAVQAIRYCLGDIDEDELWRELEY